MPLGSTNVKLQEIYDETIAGGTYGSPNVSLGNYGLYAWPSGPAPQGDGTVDFFGSALKSGIQQDILYNPVNNGASAAGSTTNYKMGYYKNFYGHMNQVNYYVELYIENNIGPAGRFDPPNDVNTDMQMIDYNDASTVPLCALDGNAAENGGTYSQIKDNSDTFNVYYMWVKGAVSCNGIATYDLSVYVNGNNVYNNTGLNGTTNQDNYVTANDWGSTPTNGGTGFSMEFYFS